MVCSASRNSNTQMQSCFWLLISWDLVMSLFPAGGSGGYDMGKQTPASTKMAPSTQRHYAEHGNTGALCPSFWAQLPEFSSSLRNCNWFYTCNYCILKMFSFDKAQKHFWSTKLQNDALKQSHIYLKAVLAEASFHLKLNSQQLNAQLKYILASFTEAMRPVQGVLCRKPT